MKDKQLSAPEQGIVTTSPHLKTNNAQRLAGKYSDYIPKNLRDIDFAQEREAVTLAAFKEKGRNGDPKKALQLLDELDALGL